MISYLSCRKNNEKLQGIVFLTPYLIKQTPQAHSLINKNKTIIEITALGI